MPLINDYIAIDIGYVINRFKTLMATDILDKYPSELIINYAVKKGEYTQFKEAYREAILKKDNGKIRETIGKALYEANQIDDFIELIIYAFEADISEGDSKYCFKNHRVEQFICTKEMIR